MVSWRTKRSTPDMARESAKRVQPSKTKGPSSRVSPRPAAPRVRSAAPVSERVPESQRDLPASQRAPGRGKYDRSRSADERQKDQQRRLLEAASIVFAEMGWADATVEAIVNRAGMSRRTFYEHFDDLKDCLLVLHQKVSKLSFRAVENQVQAQTDPPEMLRMGIMAFLGGIAMFPHMARVMFRVVRSAGPEFERVHEQMMARFAKLVLDGVEASFESGRGHGKRPADGQVELRVFALVSGMEAVAMRYVMRGEEAKALEAAPILMDMVQRTFRA
jgi:AcrR family transcriptional regulator